MENKKQKKALDSDSRLMAITVKAVVFSEKNEILILKRAKDVRWNAGSFDLPGGHIGEEESFKDTIIREIKEEAGLETVFEEVIDVVEFPKDSPLFKEEKRGIRCICRANSEKEVKLSHEHEEFLWLSIDKALEKFDKKDGFENEKRETILRAKEYLEMKNSLAGWKRSLADFENYKKRQAEDRTSMIAFSNLNLILEILPVLDNFYAATEHIPEGQKENPWTVGIMHIQKQLEKVLADNGVEEITVKEGDEFDPQTMEAVENKDEKKKENKNMVKKVLMKGYKMGPARNASHSDAGGGKVVRAARVVVE